MKYELLMSYLLPVIGAALTALAGFLGAQLKKIYQKYVDDRTKEAVVRTCVKAVEQLYHDLGGPQKLEKAKDGIQEMLKEKGIAISELEMDLLIESVVSEFNYGFNTAVRSLDSARDDKAGDARNDSGIETVTNEGAEGYSEEGGSV